MLLKEMQQYIKILPQHNVIYIKILPQHNVIQTILFCNQHTTDYHKDSIDVLTNTEDDRKHYHSK